MDFSYAIPGVAALIEWLLAAALYGLGWYRVKHDLYRFGDSLSAAGLVTALGGAVWLASQASLNPALVRSSLATGLAVSALVIYAVLARGRTERLPAAVMLGFAILIQSFAVVHMFWPGTEATLPQAFLPLGIALSTLTGLVGYGGLAVSAMMVLLSFTLARMRQKLSLDRLKAALGLRKLEWQSWQIALVALSISISISLIRTWLGLGQVMVGNFPWALITWLLLAAGAYGLLQGAAQSRLARALLVLACVAGIVSVLTMAGPLTWGGPLAGAG